MDRDTIEIKVGKHVLIIKSYATAREKAAIQNTYFAGTKVDVVAGQPQVNNFNPAIQHEVNQEMVRQIAVIMDGSSENIVERCLELPSDEFDEIVKAIDEQIASKKRARGSAQQLQHGEDRPPHARSGPLRRVRLDLRGIPQTA